MDNPFIFNGYCGANFFCDRKEELETLVQCANSNINVTLVSQRRMGKTGLIHRLMEELKANDSHIIPIYVDIFATRDIADFNKTLADTIFKIFPEESSVGKKFLALLKGFRPLIGIDPLTGAPQVQLSYQNQSEKEHTLESLLKFLENQRNPVLLAIDEFQQIREYPDANIEALLRTNIQRLHNVRFIFSGSKKHLMTDMFTNPKRPFYASTQFVGLDYIPVDSYKEFIQRNFTENGKVISEEAIDYILNWTRRHTYYTQRLCHDVFELGQNSLDTEIVMACCDRLLKLNEPYFLQYRQLLTAGQWNYLIALAKEDAVNQPYNNVFLRKYNIGAPAVARRHLQALINKDLVFEDVRKDTTNYVVADLFLMRWLKREY